MAIRKYLELHPTSDTDLFDVRAPHVRPDDVPPEFAAPIRVLEVTGRAGFPFANKLWKESTDTFINKPPPPVLPPTAEEVLQAADDLLKVDFDLAMAKAHGVWTAGDRSIVSKSTALKVQILNERVR